MKAYLRLLAPVALAAGVACGAFAQNAPPAAEAPPRYRVEVIVFANRDRDPNEERLTHRRPGDEAPDPLSQRRPPPLLDESFSLLEPLPEVPAEPPPGSARTPLPPASPETLPPASAETLPNAGELLVPEDDLQTVGGLKFRLLRPDELQLTRQYRALSRIDAYQPLLHGGWVQEGLPEQQARPFDVALLGVVNPSGTIRVHLSRFLHVRVDLLYQDASRGSPMPATLAELREIELAPRYQLTAERQTRSGELHYFDHPAFGVLVMITPVPTEPATPSGAQPRIPAA